MFAVYKKELHSYFTSMIGFVFLAIYLVIIGIYFSIYNLFSAVSNFEYVLQDIAFLFILVIPMLTMRLLAEERKQKTDQLLFTSPVPVGKIVIGKYFAALTTFLIAIAIAMLYPLIIKSYGQVQLGLTYTAFLGFILFGAAYLSIGMYISALTESQVIALVITAIVVFLTYFMKPLATNLPTDSRSSWIILSLILIVICILLYVSMHNLTVSIMSGVIIEIALTSIYLLKPVLFDGLVVKLLGWLSLMDRFSNFSVGVLDLADAVYYISVIALFVFLTIQAIKKRRWN